MVDKNLMSIDQVVEVNDTDMLYVVQNGTTDGRVSVGQVKDVVSEVIGAKIVGAENVVVSYDDVSKQTTISSEKNQIIRTPVAISPLTGATEFPVDGTLSASGYSPLYSVDVREFREFQIDLVEGDFSVPVFTSQIDADTTTISPSIQDNTQFKWRCRDKSLKGDYSEWSIEQTFTTYDIYIQTPSITSPIENALVPEIGGILTSSTFIAVNSDETHVASYWQIKNSVGSVIHESGRATDQLTSYNIPNGVIVAGQQYSAQVRYEGSLGTLSEFSEPVGFVAEQAAYGKYLAVATETTPFTTFYGQDVDSFDKLPNPLSAPTTGTTGVAFSGDGNYVAFSQGNVAPRLAIYKRSDDTFTKLANPAILPTTSTNDVAFSYDGTYLAFSSGASPYIIVYNRSGDTFTKLADLDIPAGVTNCTAITFSSDGGYLIAGFTQAPYIGIYKKNIDDTFTRLQNQPTVQPTGAVTCGKFSSDNSILVVSHGTTPFITIYKKNIDDTFTKLSTPDILAPNSGNFVDISVDSTYIALAHSGARYITIYKNNGDETFSKLPDPDTLPTGIGFGCCFNSDASMLAVAHTTSPFLTIYQRTGDVFTKLPNPSTLPPGNCKGVSFYPRAY